MCSWLSAAHVCFTKVVQGKRAKGSPHDTRPPSPPPATAFKIMLTPTFIALSHTPSPSRAPRFTAFPRRYHMKRCEDSGLWVTGAGGSNSVGEDEEEEEYDLDEEEAAAAEGTDASVPVSPPSP